jgi:hypothetical protein
MEGVRGSLRTVNLCAPDLHREMETFEARYEQ